MAAHSRPTYHSSPSVLTALTAARPRLALWPTRLALIVTRTVAMLANLAADALDSRVASEADIDTAMRLGVNYPLGPLAWAREWGIGSILTVLDSLENWYRDGHYRASPLLRRAALSQRAPAGGTLLPRQSQPSENL